MNDRGALSGEIPFEDVRRALIAEGRRPASHAADIMRPVPEPLVLDDNLALVARKLAAHQSGAMTVVASRSDRTVIGIFGRSDLIVAYGRLLQRLHGATETDTPDASARE